MRLWRVERSQKDILKWMRTDGPGLDPKRELLAYWKFDDPDTCARALTAIRPCYPTCSSACLDYDEELCCIGRAQLIMCTALCDCASSGRRRWKAKYPVSNLYRL